MFEKPVVVYICPSFNAIERENIKYKLRTKMPMAVITDTTEKATLIIDKAPTAKEFLVKNIELPDIFSVLVPHTIKTKERQNKNIQNRAVQQFNKAKQFQKRVVFNRTKHK